MRTALICRLLLVAAATLVSGSALAGKRVALVIGNSNYQHVGKLPNPTGDAAAIATLFKSVGFDSVEERNDLGVTAFRHAIREFAERSRGADMAVVFYAGHGMEVAGANYLIPTDAKLKTDLDIDDEAVPLDRVLRALEAAQTRLVILDACRDNPFVSTMSRLASTRSIGRGLARIEPTSSDMLIAFAAKAGSIAADGADGHSPFTSALVKYVAEPGLDIRLALGKVRDDVLHNTHGRQEPFTYGSLGGSTIAIAPTPAKPAPAAEAQAVAAAPADPMAAARSDYEFAERVGTTDAWDLFLKRYPSGFYADLARAQVAKLAAVPAQAAPAAVPVAASPQLDPRPAAPIVVASATPEPQPAAAGAGAAATSKQAASPAGAVHAEPDLVVISPNPAPPASSEPPAKPAATEPPPADIASPPQKSASLTVPAVEAPSAGPHKSIVFETIRALQLELKRVGCDPGSDLGLWSDASKRALEKFNHYAGTQLMVKVASVDALETVKAQKDRVCPLACRAGYHADGNRCVRGRKKNS